MSHGAAEHLTKRVAIDRFQYPKLAKLVDGKRVHILGENASSENSIAAEDVIVRFNHHQGYRDVWVTELHPAPELEITLAQMISNNARTPLIVGSRPNKNMRIDKPNYLENVSVKDWEDRYQALRNRENFEAIKAAHFLQLCVAMPCWPLAGMVILSLLRTTNFHACEIRGFDFYMEDALASKERLFKREKPDLLDDGVIRGAIQINRFTYLETSHRYTHDILASIDWLGKLLTEDSRFEWKGPEISFLRSLWEPRVMIGWRKFFLYV